MRLTTEEASLVGKRELEAVRKAARAVREAPEELRQRIIVARGSGETMPAIAAAAGLTKQRIQQILKGGASDA